MKRLSVIVTVLAVLFLLFTSVYAAKPASNAGSQTLPAGITLKKSDPNMAKVIEADILETYEGVLNKYKNAFYFWYDTYAEGEVPAANVVKADGLIKMAEKLIDEGVKNSDMASFYKADNLLAQADTLLNVKVKSPDQFPYDTDLPLQKQDKSKVYKAKAADYLTLDRYGVKMNDVGPSIWGYGDDGEYYFVMVLFNYHALPDIVVPVVIEVMSTKDPNKRYIYLLNNKTKVTQTADSADYIVVDGKKSFHMLVKDVPEGGTTCMVEGSFPAYPGKAPAISFKITTAPAFTYWYNQNQGAAMMYPDIVLAGFEQPGPAWGTITMGDKTATLDKTAGAVTEICMVSGAPGKPYKEYRTNMSKYGNEWYIAVHTDQVDAMFISYGKFRDSAIYYKGQYIIPTEYKLIPGIANKTITLIAKTKEFGDLKLNFEMKLHDPVYTERAATVGGTFDGKVLTNGGAWFEHCFKGSPNGIIAVQEYPQIVDPM
jgi:hypothetical protein